MAKSQLNQATQMAQNLAKGSTGQTQAGLFGSSGGAFGSPGLTPQYTQQSGWQQQSRNQALQAAQSVANTGGYDPTTLSQLRYGGAAAMNNYLNIAGTGGFSEADKARYLNQATSGITNTYDVLAQQAQRQRAATGGLGPDTTSQMARQLANTQGTTTTKALDDLHTQIVANELAANQGISNLETTWGGLETNVARGKQEGAQLLSQVYNLDTGALTETGKEILGLLGIDSTNQVAALDAMTRLAADPSLLSQLLLAAIPKSSVNYNINSTRPINTPQPSPKNPLPPTTTPPTIPKGTPQPSPGNPLPPVDLSQMPPRTGPDLSQHIPVETVTETINPTSGDVTYTNVDGSSVTSNQLLQAGYTYDANSNTFINPQTGDYYNPANGESGYDPNNVGAQITPGDPALAAEASSMGQGWTVDPNGNIVFDPGSATNVGGWDPNAPITDIGGYTGGYGGYDPNAPVGIGQPEAIADAYMGYRPTSMMNAARRLVNPFYQVS